MALAPINAGWEREDDCGSDLGPPVHVASEEKTRGRGVGRGFVSERGLVRKHLSSVRAKAGYITEFTVYPCIQPPWKTS